MLESGYTVFDCQIVKPLLENDVYRSYLVSCPDSRDAKLFWALPDPLLDQQQQQSRIDHADWLSSQVFPGIGSPLQAGQLDGGLAYLYPYPQGKPLRQDLGGGFTVRQSVDLISKIAMSLSAAHSAGLCHGNLSPESIYTEGESSYLADFALNQLIRLDFHSGIDPQYTSPEQVRGDTPSPAADIYSLGCIFYHMLIGTPPFTAEEPFAIAKQHLQGEFPPLPEELMILQPLLVSMTAVAAEERITIDALKDQINMLLDSAELDQISLEATTEDRAADDSSAGKSSSLLDEALSSSEIAARIEARLKEHAVDFPEPEVFENQLGTGDIDVASELDKVPHEKKIGFGRVILILLLGVFIGSGLYFVLNKQLHTVTPATVDPVAPAEDTTIVDLDRGLQLWKEADFNGAEVKFKRIIAENQKDPRAYNNLAAFYAGQGNYEQARDYLEQALATDERYATIYRNLGSVYAEMARGSYGRALQLDHTRGVVSLPVFSSRGVVKLESVSGAVTKTLVADAETESAPSTLADAGKKISAAKVAQIAESEDIPLTAAVKQEPLVAMVVEESSLLTTKEHPVIEASLEPLGISETSGEVAIDVQAKNVENFLRRWAQSWSNQDVDAYLSFYGDKFVPPAGRSRADWEAQRRSRLLAPNELLVNLSDFEIIQQQNGRLQVEVIQSYKSNLLKDQFKKVFDLQQTDTGWEILRERSLGRVR